MNRVVCVGNALRGAEDGAGAEALALLRRRGTPPGVEAVDGGLSGLDLLGALEGAGRVVFIDSVRGFAAPGEVVRLAPDLVAREASSGLDHASGLAYLLGVYEAALEGPAPRVEVVGVEEPRCPGSAARAVDLALALLSPEVADAEEAR